MFEEKLLERPLNITAILNYDIDKLYYNKIKMGGDIVLEDGRVIPNSELTFEPSLPNSYAFCSDTLYTKDILPIIKM